MQFKDLEAIEKNLEKARKMARTGDKTFKRAVEILEQYQKHLEEGKSARSLVLDDKSRELVGDMMLLTEKPVLYVCNVDEASALSGNDFTKKVEELVADESCEVIYLCAAVESDIAEFEDYEEKQMFLEEMGLSEPGVNTLIGSAYKLLNLETYFTAGVKEVRAWTIKRGMSAPQAAGVIHTDFEKGFIRAEVIKYSDFVELGSESACRDAGKLHVEGKEYIVEDGDVMHFRFNV